MGRCALWVRRARAAARLHGRYSVSGRNQPRRYGQRDAARGEDLALLLQPRPGPDGTRLARLGISLGAGDLLSQEEILRAQSRTAVAAVEADAIAIETPDPAVNRALASAVLALDAAWVCNDALGCGTVAGYGASRPGRRPQYAWFFAGDGLFAADAYADAGLQGRARDELTFVMRYPGYPHRHGLA